MRQGPTYLAEIADLLVDPAVRGSSGLLRPEPPTGAPLTAPAVSAASVPDDLPFPATVEGQQLCVNRHRQPDQRGHYTRLIVDCPLSGGAHDPRCSKRRSCGPKTQAGFGPEEPVAFVGAWLEKAGDFNSAAEHLAYNPSRDEVRDYHLRKGDLRKVT